MPWPSLSQDRPLSHRSRSRSLALAIAVLGASCTIDQTSFRFGGEEIDDEGQSSFPSQTDGVVDAGQSQSGQGGSDGNPQPSDAGGATSSDAAPVGVTNACQEGETRSCGPETVAGLCELGTLSCVGGVWGPCEGAVFPAARDCSSQLDADCDGLPDNTVDDVCRCADGTEDSCDEHPDLDGRGPCIAGTRICVVAEDGLSSDWGPCMGSVGPLEADSCDVEGDDSNCNGTANDDCFCVEGKSQECGPPSDNGICVRGTQICRGARYEACVGAVFPLPRDCSSPVDNDCNGLPDNTLDATCTCTVGTSESCDAHPGQDGNGACKAGLRTCLATNGGSGSAWGACAGSVGPSLRDCSSPVDNDCNGLPDNTLDATCACTIAAVQDCNAHPGLDGIGRCRAGRQVCVPGPQNQSSAFGICEGSIGPLPADSCLLLGDDSNCDGVPNGGCQCVAGTGNAACSSTPSTSVCSAQGTCVPCQADADCSLVAGRGRCSAGTCVACVADADCAGQGGACQAGLCVGCTNDLHCPEPTASRCDQSSFQCAACVADLDCSHLTATRACSQGTCRECTESNSSACGAGELCDLSSGTCVLLSPAGLCEACTNSAQCGASAACVLERGAFKCLPRASAGSCTTPPFASPVSLADVGGQTLDACLPRLTSCAAITAIDGTACSTTLPCGSDAVCVLDPAPATTGTCSLPCADAADCPAPRTCASGACSPL